MSSVARADGRSIHDLVERYEERDLLRFLTCGSVDDGKSTLIGRLLHDSNLVYEDQLAAAKRATKPGGEEIDYSLLLDGLDAEREQGITIDVAYRYFSTAKRKFIIADTPGHEQYTRNMVTGASNCDLAIILIDARKGVLRQTRRHMFIASLLGIRHLVVAVNKMDLVGYDEQTFERIRHSVSDFAAKLQISDMEFIPLSALKGDNVVHRSEAMPWYQGPPLLPFLETVHIASDRNLIDMRFPVQYVLRPNADFRGYCGSVVSGVVRKGQDVVVLPSGRRAKIRSVLSDDSEVDEAPAPMSVTITLTEEVDVSRGDMIVPENNNPHLSQHLEAMLVWMTDEPLKPDSAFIVKHTTMESPAVVSDIRYRINVDDLHRQETGSLELNEIGRIRLEVPRPVAYDAYVRNRQTGSFILIDRISNATVAAGMIVDRESVEDSLEHRRSVDAGSNLREEDRSLIPEGAKAQRLAQEPVVVWLTGLPRSGKSSIAWALEAELFGLGRHVAVLDGERIRRTISADLGFSHADRMENVRRTAELARELLRQGMQVIVALVSQSEDQRAVAREIIGGDRLIEVFCDAPLEVCEARDTAGLYARARTGEITNVTGINFPYEAPARADLTLPTDQWDVDRSVEAVVEVLRERGFLGR
ncbi:MAG: sulfate adenylyltransferase subunit CysN [Acidobacteria bacterium]|nr:sulfate adenylyltransferase subunit CysN [Acidobacteriota bacterium]